MCEDHSTSKDVYLGEVTFRFDFGSIDSSKAVYLGENVPLTCTMTSTMPNKNGDVYDPKVMAMHKPRIMEVEWKFTPDINEDRFVGEYMRFPLAFSESVQSLPGSFSIGCI